MTQQDNGGLLPWELRAIRNLIANPVSPGAASIARIASPGVGDSGRRCRRYSLSLGSLNRTVSLMLPWPN